MSAPKNSPTETGLYFAATGSRDYWDLIVEVRGDSPFFTLTAWTRWSDQVGRIPSWEVKEFGPKISYPAQEYRKGK